MEICDAAKWLQGQYQLTDRDAENAVEYINAELVAEAKRLTRALELVCTHKIHVRYGWNAAGNTYGYWAIHDSQWHGPFSTRVEAVLAADAAGGSG